jgi:hypothetical protein
VEVSGANWPKPLFGLKIAGENTDVLTGEDKMLVENAAGSN